MAAILAGLLGLAPGAAVACEFHGGPWGMAFARMMHAGPAADEPATPEAQAQEEAQANEAAITALRAQFLQRFNVKVEGEPAAPATSAAPAPSLPPTP